VGPQTKNMPLPVMPGGAYAPYSLKFDLSGALENTDSPGDASYLYKMSDGTSYKGKLDDSGMTGRIFSDKKEPVQLSVKSKWRAYMDASSDDPWLYSDVEEN